MSLISKNIFRLLTILIIIPMGCKKFLDAKPDKNLVAPDHLQDLQALLDNNNIMNATSAALGEGSADDYYLSYANWASLISESYKNVYIWGDEIFFDDFPNTWYYSYTAVYYANTVIENIKKIDKTNNIDEWNNLKGSTLFYRAKVFLTLAWDFAKAYDPATAATDPGIPLRLNTDFNERSTRASVQDTYDQVIKDLQASIPLLPVMPAHVMRPSKPAAYAYLARTFLSMRNYKEAGLYADSCLQLFSQLIDFNSLDSAEAYPVNGFNSEVIFQNFVLLPQNLNNSRARIDSGLYHSYKPDDLRKALFFKNIGDGSFAFRGSYNGSKALFDGMAVDEVYLIRSECYARADKIDLALKDLNTLLAKRWKSGTFVPFSATDKNDALQDILTERRKELLMRDLRWMDIKRLNKEGADIMLKRILDDEMYALPPNDPRYALPFPRNIIDLSGMKQN